ncbi:MAG: FAD-dependent oxidoreductase [Cyanobacteria bacterium P01_H01_bin.74]
MNSKASFKGNSEKNSERNADAYDCIVVGAGLAGLTAANTLTGWQLPFDLPNLQKTEAAEKNRSVLVLEKSRGIGGRMATRRLDRFVDASQDQVHATPRPSQNSPTVPGVLETIEDYGETIVDHGAQFFTARTDPFQTLTRALEAAGVVHAWFYKKEFYRQAETAQKESSTVKTERHETPSDRFTNPNEANGLGEAHYAASTGMTAVGKVLAGGDFSIQYNTTVTEISRASDHSGWVVQATCSNEKSARIQSFQCKHLILTPPVPQAMALLSPSLQRQIDPQKVTALNNIQYHPCIAIMIALSPDCNANDFLLSDILLSKNGFFDNAARNPGSPIAVVSNNRQKRQKSRHCVLTVHLSHDFSQRHFETPEEQIWQEILADLIQIFPKADWTSKQCIEERSWQRWRYSKPANSNKHAGVCFVNAAGKPQPFASLLETRLEQNDNSSAEAQPHTGLYLAGDGFGGPRVEGAFLSGLAVGEYLSSGACGSIENPLQESSR